jgi:hypothetical protein
MTIGFLKDGKRHFVTIFTAHEDSVSLNGGFRYRPKLITPKISSPRKIFPLSQIGRELDVSHCEYNSTSKWIAVLDSIFHIQHNKAIWEKLCTNDVFDIWQPEAPYNMLTHNARNQEVARRDPMILLLRICEVDHDFSNEISPGQYWDTIEPLTVRIIRTKIDNERFEEIRRKIIDVLNGTLGVGKWRPEVVNNTQQYNLVKGNNSEKAEIPDREIIKKPELPVASFETKKTVTVKLVNEWRRLTEGTETEKLNQLSERAMAILLLDKLSSIVEAGITKELWDIVDRDELIQNIGNPSLFYIEHPISSDDIETANGARGLMMVWLNQLKGNKTTRMQQICDRIWGLYSLGDINELKNVFNRIHTLINFDELFELAIIFGAIGDNVMDYLM